MKNCLIGINRFTSNYRFLCECGKSPTFINSIFFSILQERRHALLDEASDAFKLIAPFGKELDKILSASFSKDRKNGLHRFLPSTQHPADYVNSQLGIGRYQFLFDGLARLSCRRVVNEDEQAIRAKEIQKLFCELEKGAKASLSRFIKNENIFRICLSSDLESLRQRMVSHQQGTGFLKLGGRMRDGYKLDAFNTEYCELFRKNYLMNGRVTIQKYSVTVLTISKCFVMQWPKHCTCGMKVEGSTNIKILKNVPSRWWNICKGLIHQRCDCKCQAMKRLYLYVK